LGERDLAGQVTIKQAAGGKIVMTLSDDNKPRMFSAVTRANRVYKTIGLPEFPSPPIPGGEDQTGTTNYCPTRNQLPPES
jgi:hypothetical protein